MKLEDLLKTITHRNYKIFVENTVTKVFERPLELTTIEDIKDHFDYPVLSIDEHWNITVRGE